MTTSRTPKLVGRAEELKAVQAALHGGGCLLAGPPGVGKSRLAAEAVDSSGTVLQVLATASAASVPFGAFGHLLAAHQADTGSVIPTFVHRLRTEYGRVPPVVLVDDAHYLDDGSAALVLALARSAAARPLVTIRVPEPAPDAVTALWKDRLLARVDVQALGPGDVRGMIADLLGGDPHGVAARRIFELSQGVPLYVVSLVHDALRTGALHQRESRWHWDEERLEFDRLTVLIDRRVRDVGTDASHALELLAVGGPLPTELLVEAAGVEAVEELEQRGLAQVRGPAGGAMVQVAHPLFAEVVLASIPRTTAQRLRRELASAYGRSGPPDDEGRLRRAALMLEAGDSDPGLFVAASAHAMRRGAPDLAARLATRAGDSLDAALALGGALNGLARFDEVDAVLAPHRQAARSAQEAMSTPFVETWFRGLLCGSGPDVAVSAMLDSVAEWHQSATWGALIASSRGWLLQFDNRPAESLALLEPWTDDAGVHPYRRFLVIAEAFYAELRLGRTDDAMGRANQLAAMVAAMARAPWETRYAQLWLTQLPKIVAAQDLPQVEATLSEGLTASTLDGDNSSRVVAVMGLGWVALLRGHAARAAALLGEAADALDHADPALDGFESLGRLAAARALAGDHAGALDAIARAERIGDRQVRVARRLSVEMEHSRLLAASLSGRPSIQAAGLIALACGARENPVAAVAALYDAVRLGAPAAEVAAVLAARTPGMQGEFVPSVQEHVEALAGGSPQRQLEAARRFGAIGLDLYAAEAAAGAARAFLAAGEVAHAQAAMVLRDHHLAACGPVSTLPLLVAPAQPMLTSRELEVATMAAKGMSNQAIADELIISVRTVETCVLRACRKLDVPNRRALAAALSVGD